MQHPPTPSTLATPNRLEVVLRRAAVEVVSGLLGSFELGHFDPYDRRAGVTCPDCHAAAVVRTVEDLLGWCVDHVDGPRHHAATLDPARYAS